MSYRNFRLATDNDGIATVTWDMPDKSMNVIDMSVMDELQAIVDEVSTNDAIKGVIVTSGKDSFSGGADLKMLEALNDPTEMEKVRKGDEEAIRRHHREQLFQILKGTLHLEPAHERAGVHIAGARARDGELEEAEGAGGMVGAHVDLDPAGTRSRTDEAEDLRQLARDRAGAFEARHHRRREPEQFHRRA